MALALTLLCIVVGITSTLSTFAATFAFTIGLSSFGAAVALIMSARNEEQVHEFAAKLDGSDIFEPSIPSDPLLFGSEDDGTDGTVDGTL